MKTGKTGTIRTLGAAALGVVFAAAAGSASAAAAVPGLPSLPLGPDATSAVSNLASAIPLSEVGKLTPAGDTLRKAPDAVSRALPDANTDGNQGLLGGLPTGSLPGGGALGGA